MAIVEMPLLVDDDKQIVVQMCWIGILGRPIGFRSGAEYPPGACPEKMLARYFGEGSNDCF